MIFDTKDIKSFPFRLPNRRRYSASERATDSLSAFALGVLGLPALIGLAMMPFWDQIGEWRIFASINDMLAPAIGKLPNLHDVSLTRRRFMIGASVLLYALFIGEFVVLLASKKRRFLNLEYYDVRKYRFYIALFVSWACMAVSWLLIFVNQDWMYAFGVSGKFVGYLTVWLPLLTVHVSRMTTIALIGITRDIRQMPRYLRKK